MKNLNKVVRLLVFLYVCGAGVLSVEIGVFSDEEPQIFYTRAYSKLEEPSRRLIVEAPLNERRWHGPEEYDVVEDDIRRLLSNSDKQPADLPSSVPAPEIPSVDTELTSLIPPPDKPITNNDLANLEKLEGKVHNLMTELKAQQDKFTELEKVNKKLQDKVDLIEQQVKTNNLVFFNVPESRYENHKMTQQKVLQLLNKVMRVRTDAADIAMALRADGNSTDDRPIVVKFTNFATKMRVMAAKNRLGRSDVKVVADYSEQVNQRRSELVPYLRVLRSQGHHAFLVYDKLVVDGVAKTLQELQADESLDPSFIECGLSGTTTEQDPNPNPDEQVEEVEVDTPFQDYEE